MEIAVGRELLFFPALIIGGMCLLAGLVWLYEKTRRKIQHPRLGTLTFDDQSWSGSLPHFQGVDRTVSIELPGAKSGPQDGDIERFEAIWRRLPQLLELVRPHAVEEFESLGDEEGDGDLESFDRDWSLTGIALRQGQLKPWYWCLEFDAGWDAENSRSAYLDLDGQFLLYDLSCAEVEL